LLPMTISCFSIDKDQLSLGFVLTTYLEKRYHMDS
jgi:hypothetical protein